MFLAEPGWRIGVKAGSDREFCYMMTPGQDFYHRLLDGEIFLHRHEEKLCLACAIATRPDRLRAQAAPRGDHPAPGRHGEHPPRLGWRDAERS